MNNQMPFPMQRGDSFGRVVDMHNGGSSPLDWAIFALLLLLVLLVVTQLVATLLRPRGRGRWGMRHKGPGPWGPPDPLAFARLRYARGEIDRDAYVQLTQDLGGAPEPPAAPAPV